MDDMDEKRLSGSWGEERALSFLLSRGYRLLERNYRSRYGELDLIMRDDRFLVFAEVKARKRKSFARAREAVTPAKRERLVKTARLWLAENEDVRLQPRFDVVEIYAPEGEGSVLVEINHLQNVFF